MPGPSIGTYLALFLMCLALSFFFSYSEAAFLSVSRLRLRTLVEKGIPRAQRALALAERTDRLLATVLLGNNTVNTAAASVGTAALILLLGSEGWGVAVATASIAAILAVLGDLVPKSLAASNPERTALRLVTLVEWAERIVYPVAAVLQRISRGVVRLMGAKTSRPPFTEEELHTVIQIGKEAGVVEEEEAHLFANIFRLCDRQVRQVMTPRTAIQWVAKGTSLADFLTLYLKEPHTRYPVYEGTPDNPIGVVDIRTILRGLAQGTLHPHSDITTLATPPIFIPETAQIGALLQQFRQSGQRLAIVVDEFGGVAGMVTWGQIVRAIVGVMGDEGKEAISAVGPHVYEVDGSLPVDEVNQRLGLSIPPGDYDTLAGWVMTVLGRVPKVGDGVEYQGFKFVVARTEGARVSRIYVVRKGEPLPAIARHEVS
ncbi:MAG: hemolysin family protein [Dehalococcoidia bacterium]|nr:hemolysin family protein [Dehalococcoidia bacterium]MDW8120408.1 hemolysin family protein [Chloroflexota bacterium]